MKHFTSKDAVLAAYHGVNSNQYNRLVEDIEFSQ